MNTESTDLEVIPNSALEAITRGEIDTQIRTAKAYPRSMKKFLSTAIDQATAHVEIAESFIYVRPVGKKDGKMQYAEGLSVRAAEIVGAAYGNLRVGSMIIEQTDRYVVTRGFAHDLESNFASTSENKEPTVTKDGKPFSEGMRAVIAKASLAKARRDATFQVVPKALCRPIETAARALIAGDAKSLESRRASAVQWIQRLNIEPARVWAALGIAGEEELTSELLLTLSGIRTAIKDGDTKIEDAFPNIASVQAPAKATQKTAQAPAESPKAEPPKATPAQGIANLCKASGVTESALLQYLVAQGACDENAGKLEDVDSPTLEKVKVDWVDRILPALTTRPAAPASADQGDHHSSEGAAIPTEHGDLVKYVRSKLDDLALDEKQVVKFVAKQKKCGSACKSLTDMNPSGIRWIAENIEARKDEIAAE